MKKTIGAVLLLLPAIAFAKEWECRNHEMEISCAAGKCSVETVDFTPMDIHVNSNGDMSLCMYSGCLEGKGKVYQSGNHILWSGHKLSWGDKPAKGDGMVTLDTDDNFGTVKVDSFAMPVTCQKVNNQ